MLVAAIWCRRIMLVVFAVSACCYALVVVPLRAEAVPAQVLPSCAATEYPGVGGNISIQTSPTGYVARGVTMYNLAESAGRWDIDTFANGSKTSSGFHRSVDVYIPHGAVNPEEVPAGSRFHVVATLTTAAGVIYRSVPNVCTVP